MGSNHNSKRKKTLELVINGEIWVRVDNFANSKPFDRHFTLKRLENGHDVIVFGNGKFGSRPGDRYEAFSQPVQVDTKEESTTNEINQLPLIKNLTGIYRAVIVNNEDPDLKQQLHVKIDKIPEMGLLWASPILPSNDQKITIPSVGDIVWVTFKEGDPNRPVWLGKINE